MPGPLGGLAAASPARWAGRWAGSCGYKIRVGHGRRCEAGGHLGPRRLRQEIRPGTPPSHRTDTKIKLAGVCKGPQREHPPTFQASSTTTVAVELKSQFSTRTGVSSRLPDLFDLPPPLQLPYGSKLLSTPLLFFLNTGKTCPVPSQAAYGVAKSQIEDAKKKIS